MAAKVVDASALAAVLFGEPEAERVVEQMANARLMAPSLLTFELANVCVMKGRRSPEQRSTLHAAFRLREKFGIEERAVDPDSVLQLAEEARLTAYDASYLWLSLHFGLELLTLDQQLIKALDARRR